MGPALALDLVKSEITPRISREIVRPFYEARQNGPSLSCNE